MGASVEFHKIVDSRWCAFSFNLTAFECVFEVLCEGASLCCAAGVAFYEVIIFVKKDE